LRGDILFFSEDALREILAAALAAGGDFAEIFIERRDITNISCEDNKIERLITGRDQGAGIRVLKGDKTAYGYTTHLHKETLISLAQEVARVLAPGQARELVLTRPPSPVEFVIKERPDQVEVKRKVDLVLQVNSAARQVDPRVVQVVVGYGDGVQQVTIANSEGVLVEDERLRCRLVIQVIASDGQIIQTAMETIGGHKGWEIFQEVDPLEKARQTARRAVALLTAPPAPAGKMPVIMSGEAGGTMIHEACGHGLEADLVQKQLSVYSGKKGQMVASPLITVIDDPTLPGKYGSYRFDDEGTPAQRTVLIEKGVLKEYLYDYLTARKEGRASTGNGRRESYQYRPIPRMSNTFIAPGEDRPEDILRDTPHGLLVKRMGGGQVNTVTGDFVFEVAEGYLIQGGQLGPLVRGATLTGNGPEVLKIIDRVGNDLGFALGVCGKDGQGVPVGDAQPTIRIPEIIVGGLLPEEGKK